MAEEHLCPASQSMRNKVAKMKLIPVHELIDGHKGCCLLTIVLSEVRSLEKLLSFCMKTELKRFTCDLRVLLL